MRSLIILIFAVLIVGCGEKSTTSSPINNTNIATQITNNAFEDAINFKTGNKKAWDSFKDNGGLNKLNDLYGLSITSISATWNNETGQFTGALMQADASSTSPKDVRASLSKVCGITEGDWTIRTDYEPTGKAIKDGLTCYYIFSTATVDISVMRESTANKDQK
jgi:hypothetical protein